MSELSAKQRQILEYMKAEVREKGYPPSVREICDAVGLKSTSTVHGHLSRLEKKGLIRRDPTKPRAIEILDSDFDAPQREFVNVPIVGNITAGIPILAVENIEDTFPIPVDYIHNDTVFMLRVKGESMIEAGIFDKDLILVRQQQDANNGDIVVALIEDFATVNPYLGSDGVKPFIDVCKQENKGLFILVKTSNPSSGEFQDRIAEGRPVYEWVGEKVAEWGADCMGDEYSYIGAVVGATYPEMGKVLREIMPKSYILVPGYGAQGGQGKDLVHFFNEDGLGAIVNSSRGIIAAYKQEAYAKFGPENFGDASRAAVEAMVADISGALAAAK